MVMTESERETLTIFKNRLAHCNYAGLDKVYISMVEKGEFDTYVDCFSNLITSYRDNLMSGKAPKVIFAFGSREFLNKFLVVFIWKYLSEQCFVFSANDAMKIERELSEDAEVYRLYTETSVLNLGNYLSNFGKTEEFRDEDLLGKTGERQNSSKGTLVLSEYTMPDKWIDSKLFEYVGIKARIDQFKKNS